MRMFIDAILVLLVARSANTAEILCAFTVPSISHQAVFQPLWKALSLKGHHVTVITPNPLRDPKLTNLTEIDISFLYASTDSLSSAVSTPINHWRSVKTMLHLTRIHRELLFSHSEITKLINNTSKTFDVVLVETMAPDLGAFAVRSKCPLIGVASGEATIYFHGLFGVPVHPLLTSWSFKSYTEEQTFLERLDSVLFSVYYMYLQCFVKLPEIDMVVRKYFGNDMPYFGDILKNMAMLFANINPVIHGGQPKVPGIVSLGRMHIRSKKALPEDLQDFLDSSKEGVVYFSLGTNVNGSYIEKNKQNLMMKAFSELPYKVLWKFEGDEINGVPDNVKIRKWFPQQDILGHRNVKLFVTQAGLLSIEEAIVNRVPIIGIPFMTDQFYNAKRCATLGIGLHLDFLILTADKFKKAILEVTENPKYKQKINEVADFFLDEPNTGLERAIWWTEYVIKHKGAPYFKSSAVNMAWYQYYLIDVLFFFLTILLMVFYLVYRIIRCITKNLCVSIACRNKKKIA